MYKCERCPYSSTRRLDLRRHLARKTPCSNVLLTETGVNFEERHSQGNATTPQNVEPKSTVGEPKSTVFEQKSQNFEPKSTVGEPKSTVGEPKSTVLRNYCDRCKKQFCNRSSYNRHVSNNRCKGIEHTVCKICFKRFNSNRARYIHNRNVKCGPPPSFAETTAPVINNINTTNIDNSQNVNIHINFGQEALEKLCAHPDYLKRMEEVVRLGKYAIPQHLSDIYFNDSFPMNRTIQKTRHNDRFVKVKTGENKWDLRAVDDVYTSITQRMESYMTPYFLHVEKQMEKIYDEDQAKFKRLTRSIREFGHKVLWLDWKCDDIRQIGVELNDPYCENERARRIQEMKSLLLEHMYDKTREMLSLA